MQNQKSKNTLLIKIVIISCILMVSLLPEIIINETGLIVNFPLELLKIAFLLVMLIISFALKSINNLRKFIIILTSLIVFQKTCNYFFSKDTIQLGASNSFISIYAPTVITKALVAAAVSAALIAVNKSIELSYLNPGNMNRKAKRISWLGIDESSISWKKLSVISGLCIAAGTFLLTVLTLINSSYAFDIKKYLSIFPIIIVLAVVNAFSEGVIYRNTILGTLAYVVTKNEVCIFAGIFFGIGHYYGAPSGLIGIIMSSLLGWYICRSLYETKGFLSGLIIHFIQDVVIFSLLFLSYCN